MIDLLLFGGVTLVIVLAGTKISGLADRLADLTGLGESIMGATFLGMSTSLSGAILTATAGYEAETNLAISNAIGGIVAQTFFLVFADIYYRKANLEHAAASSTNILWSLTLIVLLSLLLVGYVMPTLSISAFGLAIHPVSLAVVIFYVFFVRYASKNQEKGMWYPKKTKQTVEDEPEDLSSKNKKRSLGQSWVAFGLLAIVLCACGVGMNYLSVEMSESLGIRRGIMGGLLTSVATSLPELITLFAAVRLNALTLAVGGIIGGNTFDVLFMVLADLTYVEGPLMAAMNTSHILLIVLGILINAILALGLLRREKYGLANIGDESFLMLLIYGVGMTAYFSVAQ